MSRYLYQLSNVYEIRKSHIPSENVLKNVACYISGLNVSRNVPRIHFLAPQQLAACPSPQSRTVPSTLMRDSARFRVIPRDSARFHGSSSIRPPKFSRPAFRPAQFPCNLVLFSCTSALFARPPRVKVVPKHCADQSRTNRAGTVCAIHARSCAIPRDSTNQT